MKCLEKCEDSEAFKATGCGPHPAFLSLIFSDAAFGPWCSSHSDVPCAFLPLCFFHIFCQPGKPFLHLPKSKPH